MKVFLSYSHEDQAVAKKVSAALRTEGLEVWDDQVEILPGDNWAEKVAQALRESEAMVVLLSPHSLNSRWIRREIEYALGEEQYKQRLIPVLIGSMQKFSAENIPWILKRLNIIELKDARGENDIKQIAGALLQAA